MSHDKVWMTNTAYARLAEELRDLAVVANDAAARGRAIELRELLDRAVTGEMPDDGLVEPGMRVTVRFNDDSSELVFILGDRTMLGLDPSIDLPVYSPTSPLGSAISGGRVGDQRVITAPRGDRRLTITEARPVS